jgi:hypothetical protein
MIRARRTHGMAWHGMRGGRTFAATTSARCGSCSEGSAAPAAEPVSPPRRRRGKARTVPRAYCGKARSVPGGWRASHKGDKAKPVGTVSAGCEGGTTTLLLLSADEPLAPTSVSCSPSRGKARRARKPVARESPSRGKARRVGKPVAWESPSRGKARRAGKPVAWESPSRGKARRVGKPVAHWRESPSRGKARRAGKPVSGRTNRRVPNKPTQQNN